MFDRASKKLGLDHAILNTSGLREPSGLESVKGNQPSGKEVDTLLRNGAYGIFNDDDEDSRTFCEADIDKVTFISNNSNFWRFWKLELS